MAKLRVLFGDAKESDILAALESLAEQQDLSVRVEDFGAVEPDTVVLPLAEFIGTTRIHEYGHDAVLALIRDVKAGDVK